MATTLASYEEIMAQLREAQALLDQCEALVLGAYSAVSREMTNQNFPGNLAEYFTVPNDVLDGAESVRARAVAVLGFSITPHKTVVRRGAPWYVDHFTYENIDDGAKGAVSAFTADGFLVSMSHLSEGDVVSLTNSDILNPVDGWNQYVVHGIESNKLVFTAPFSGDYAGKSDTKMQLTLTVKA